MHADPPSLGGSARNRPQRVPGERAWGVYCAVHACVSHGRLLVPRMVHTCGEAGMDCAQA